MAEFAKLGRYELRRVLGKGAMGVVYEGFDPSLNRPVAVKTILKSVVTDEETAVSYSARFVREAKAAARLSHANIVQVYDFGEQDDIAFLVMEFIQGRELRACFDARERFDAAETVRIMGELLSALEFAHEAGVIHRDVKPANVMLDAQRRVKLADFGVARMQDGNDRSKGGTMVGTPAFMAPEQISGGRVDRRTDVFSAGIVLYQLLTGEQPFKGEGAWTVAKQIMQDEPPRPSTIATRVSPAFDQIVNRALAKKPDQRFASAKEFSAALQDALSGSPAQRGGDAEIEFWRSIQNSSDPAEYEVYLKEFPTGVYAELARIKVAKLPRIAAGVATAPPVPAPSPPARDTQELKQLAEETARLEAELAQREAEYTKRAAEAEAKRLAEERTRAEAEAKREADAMARAAAEEKIRLAAIEQAQQEAKAEVARREAEIRQREAEFRRREAEATASAAAAAKADAEASARREAEERARREADAKARTEAEEKEKRQREELARRQAEIKQREAELKRRAAEMPRPKLPVAQLAIGFVLVAGAVIGAWYWSSSSDEARLAQLTVALETATRATQELNTARQRQQELRRQVDVAQLAEDEARERGDQAKLKELQEKTKKAEAEAQKQNELVKQREAEAKKAGDAARLADAQKQGDSANAIAEKRVAAKAAAEQIAAERVAAAEKTAAEKAVAVRAVQMPEKAATSAAVHEVKKGEGIFSISGKYRYEGMTQFQVAIAIYRANPDIFVDGINSLAPGQFLKIPNREAVTAIAPAEASREFQMLTAKTPKPALGAPAAPTGEGVLAGRHAFRFSRGSGLPRNCEELGFEEDIEIGAGSLLSASGREFRDLRLQSASDGSLSGTVNVVARTSNGDATLTGRATASGYSGNYEWRTSGFGSSYPCSGTWTMVRK